MINSFKYVFVKTNSSWFIGSSIHSLSFSSDGKTIAGTTKDVNSRKSLEEVQFWEIASGTATFSFEDLSYVMIRKVGLLTKEREGEVYGQMDLDVKTGACSDNKCECEGKIG